MKYVVTVTYKAKEVYLVEANSKQDAENNWLEASIISATSYDLRTKAVDGAK